MALAKPPSSADSAEIRLVRILPPTHDKDIPVSCEIEYVGLGEVVNSASIEHLDWQEIDDTPQHSGPLSKRYEHAFAALSYTWGDPNDTRTILVDGYPVLVRSNLEAALRRLRRKVPIRQGLRIWIDAVCINQEDISERNREVKHMRAIYKNACDVVVWLGKDEDNSRKAMDSPDNFGQGAWRGLGQLLKRSYWDRMRIIQELSMGNPRTPILCGGSIVSWSELYNAVYVFGSKHMDALFGNVEREYARAGDKSYSGLNRNKVIHFWAEQSVQAGHARPQYMPLLDLGRKAFATNERDRVYSLLGLLLADVTSLISPDYDQGVNHAFHQFATSWIKPRRDLEILEHCNGSQTGLPSWVPDWTNRDHYRLFSGRSCYKASPGELTVVEFQSQELDLVVKGAHVGTIDGLGVGFGHDYDTVQSSGGMEQSRCRANGYGSYDELRDAVWRALVGDRTPQGRAAPSGYKSLLDCPILPDCNDIPHASSRGFKTFASIMTQNRNLQIAGKPLSDFFPQINGPIPDEAQDALERIFRLHRFRKLATTVVGHLGLVPMDTQQGDQVYALQGCNVPMVLRRMTGSRHKIIGGAYLHGFMEDKYT
ncbi:het-domain-containing protein [Fusarium flagelliforme]|uniref:Het-domain-containing protein n=1 Tax=Fusarium flagelliforme TaxID=2675880 RepID=A0A395MCJ6_9HYPO|nr:het-domain-containing protein [Fusarium flagelliforme]